MNWWRGAPTISERLPTPAKESALIPQYAAGVLTVDLPERGLKAGGLAAGGLKAGAKGVVVDHTADGEAYIVEFFTPKGDTIDVVFVEADQLRPVEPGKANSAAGPAAGPAAR